MFKALVMIVSSCRWAMCGIIWAVVVPPAYDRHVSVFDVFGGGTPDPSFLLRLYRSSPAWAVQETPELVLVGWEPRQPCARSIRPWWLSRVKSRRTVARLTPNNSLSSATVAPLFCSTISTISCRRPMPNTCLFLLHEVPQQTSNRSSVPTKPIAVGACVQRSVVLGISPTRHV